MVRQRNSPVPQFLFFDQPTRAFFPQDTEDATSVEDADRAAVRNQFELLRDFVNLVEGQMQVVVCDHAILRYDGFQDALVDNWRNDRALIPVEWLQQEDAEGE